jgi:hypothetical protein
MVFVLLFSLSACSGGKGDGDTGNGAASDINSDSDHIGDGDADDSENGDSDKQSRTVNGKYEYTVAGKTIYLDVDVNDYIFKDYGVEWFDFCKMAEDYGYEPIDMREGYAWSPEAVIELDGIQYKVFLSDIGEEFEENGYSFHIVELNAFVYNEPSVSELLNTFAQLDLSIMPDRAPYRIAKTGTKRLSFDLIVMTAYTFENLKDSASAFTYGKDFPEYCVANASYEIP